MQTQTPRRIVFMLGGPGSGKGTQSGLIQEHFGFKHLSAGDLLREERASGSVNGDLIENYIKDGKIVPSEITIRLLDSAMKTNGGSRFLIDGFPRNKQNHDNWDKLMSTTCNVEFVLHLLCSEEIMTNRILQRAKYLKRVDDNVESIRKRFLTSLNETVPVIEGFRKAHMLVEVDSQTPIEDVFNAIKPHFQKILQ